MQGEGLTNEGRHICRYCVSKPVTKEALPIGRVFERLRYGVSGKIIAS